MLPTVSSQSAAAVGDSRRPADAGRSNPDPANAPAAGAFGAVLAEQTGAADSAASSRGGDGRPADDAAAPGATGGDADGNVRQARGKALPAPSTDDGASAGDCSAPGSAAATAASSVPGEPLPAAAVPVVPAAQGPVGDLATDARPPPAPLTATAGPGPGATPVPPGAAAPAAASAALADVQADTAVAAAEALPGAAGAAPEVPRAGDSADAAGARQTGPAPLGAALAGATLTGSGAPTAAATTGAQPTAPQPGSPLWADELAGRVQLLVHNGASEARLQLKPAELGSLDIRIATEGDRAVVVFHVQHGAAREAIDAAMPRLREMLEQSGLQLAHAEVSDQSQSRSGDRGASLAAARGLSPAVDEGDGLGGTAAGAAHPGGHGLVDFYA